MAQFNYTIEQVRSAISFALHTVPVESLEALFAKFGYTADEICVDAAMAAWKRYGNEFLIPFSELANEVLSDKEQMAEIKKHWLSIDRGDGKKNSNGSISTSTGSGSSSSSAWNSKTGEQKFDTVMNGIGRFFNMGMQGYATYAQIKNGQNQEETTTTTPTPTPEQTQNSFPWVAVGIGALVFILLIVLIVAMAKKK